MNTEIFIVRRIAFSNRKNFSAFIIRIAVAAVALSLATMIIATSLVNGFQKEIRHKVLSFSSHLEVVPFSFSNSLKEEGIYLHQDFYDNPSMLPEVRHIQATAFKAGLLKTGADFEGIVMKGVGLDFDRNRLEPYLIKGKFIETGSDEGIKQMLISSSTASRMKLDTGDRVTVSFMGNSIRQRPCRIQGIYETGMEEFDKRYALTDIRLIQELNHWGPDTVGGFEIFLKQENLFKSRARAYMLLLFGGWMSEETVLEFRRDPLEEISEQVYSKLSNPALDVVSVKSRLPGIFDWLDLQTMNELIILSLMLVVAAINMITALLILILERTNMIGILKALGSDNASIRKIFLYYSALIIGTGLLLGNAAGIGFCLLQDHFHLLRLPKESYYLPYAPVMINWWWILFINIGTVLITLLLLLIPSALVSSILPVKAIRFE